MQYFLRVVLSPIRLFAGPLVWSSRVCGWTSCVNACVCKILLNGVVNVLDGFGFFFFYFLRLLVLRPFRWPLLGNSISLRNGPYAQFSVPAHEISDKCELMVCVCWNWCLENQLRTTKIECFRHFLSSFNDNDILNPCWKRRNYLKYAIIAQIRSRNRK